MGTASSTGCGYLDAIRRRLYLRSLDRLDALIDRQTARAVRCLEAEEEQSERARYWMSVALKRPAAEGRTYTRTDLLTYRSLERKLASHQTKIRVHIEDMDKFAAMRIVNDRLRQMADGGNHKMAEIAALQAKLNKNPVQNAIRIQRRDAQTAMQIAQQHEAVKMANEGDKAIQNATDDVHLDVEAELQGDEAVDDMDGVELERHTHKLTSLAAIERKFTEGLLETLPVAPTRALIIAAAQPTPRSTTSPARTKKQAGKQYAELQEHKEEALEL